MAPEWWVSLPAPSPLVALLLALVGAPLTAVIGWGRPRMAAVVAVVMAVATCVAVTSLTFAGGGTSEFTWVPTLGLRFTLVFDGVSAIYGLLATGIGVAVLIYSSSYVPLHLAHHHRDPAEATIFYALILLFMGAMVGLVMANDLVLLFLFWDLTAVVSFALIGFDRDEPAARPAALMALMVTGGSAILMLAGVILLWITYATTSIGELIALATENVSLTVAVWLIVIAALAKSAQVPLHFWLPRAMVAPTPVSSYLHSAAMVAAGVFLIARLLPLVHHAAWLPQALVVVGIISMFMGGLWAISQDEFKRVLAYSTIGQYGYVVVMLGLGGTYGAIGAAFYVIAHGLAKCALFLTAGAVTEATGRKRLSETGGLWHSMPALAAGSGLAAATIAALPLTAGFFKDELFFAAMHSQGIVMGVVAVVGAALTFGYIARFWGMIFLGGCQVNVHAVPGTLVAPIVLLGGLCLITGFWMAPVNTLANAGGSASLRQPVAAELAYHLDARPENVMAVAAYAIGVGVVLSRSRWQRLGSSLAALGAQRGPERLYRRLVEGTNHLSDRLHGYEVHDLRGRIVWVLIPVGLLVLLGLIFTSNDNAFLVGSVAPTDLVYILLLVVICSAAMTASQVVGHLAAAVLLSAVGFPLAAMYAFIGAPDVALVAVLMETMLSLVLIGFLAAMRDRPRVEGFDRDPEESLRARDRFVGLAAAAASFVIVWGVLSKPAPTESLAGELVALAPSAHASDVVTAILSDFRGLDTMGEITVVAITMIGLLTLLQRPIRQRVRE